VQECPKSSAWCLSSCLQQFPETIAQARTVTQSVITETAKDATRQLEQQHQAITLAGPAVDFFNYCTA